MSAALYHRQASVCNQTRQRGGSPSLDRVFNALPCVFQMALYDLS